MSAIGTIQPEIEELGRKIFELVDADRRTPRLFGQKDFYGHLMEWAMRDPVFKTQMFRFVDVLPTLTSAGEVLRHMAEYLSSVKTPAPWRSADSFRRCPRI
jgi:RHH-type proline utilization regulon transcriptional repressor/proline dehydrogenase/delta 1-pyrroline-5-carboxylate dehydrogenase